MRHLITPVLAASAMVLSAGSAQADLGDQLAKLLPDDGAAGDEFGLSVAISGSTAIVGAWHHTDNGKYSGSAFLFDTTTGRQLFKLLRDDGEASDQFGYSVALTSGLEKQVAIVGAIGIDLGSGAAYLFDTTTGRQIGELLPDDGTSSAHFGAALAVNCTTVIIGAYGDDDNGSGSGSAYLFDTTSGEQIAKLLPDDGAQGDFFGASVAISDTTAIVGALADDDNGDLSGSAYLFDISDPANPWQIAKLLANDGAAKDIFGNSVAIGSAAGKEVALVGARWADTKNGLNSGSAYIFDTATGRQIAKLLPDDGALGDFFGASVAISPNGVGTAIVGTQQDDDNGANSGSAYLFDIADPANPKLIAKLLADDGTGSDHFGVSVALTGTTGNEVAIVGAWLDGDNGYQSGSAYLFDAATCAWDLDDNAVVGASDLLSLLASWGPCKGCAADFDGNGNVGASDLLALLANWGSCP